MDHQKVKEIINFYKKHFYAISKEELYKWRAVKHFQVNWDINADDFVEMLQTSFKRSGNLLSSGDYYPLRMLLFNAGKEPETVRAIFTDLYDEERDLIERVKNFRNRIRLINTKNLPDKKQTYQDSRAVLAYLCFRFPDRYFFYKFGMFRDFIEKIDYPYEPIIGRDENVLAFLKLCTLLREEIIKDKDLLEMHRQRLTEEHFFDSSYNILTQDVIYAAVRHIGKLEQRVEQAPALERLEKTDRSIASKSNRIILKGTFINHIENERRNKRIGDLGELLVLKYEEEKLKKSGSKNKPILVSQIKGDGEGYDILSFNESDEEMFIEVKTTTSHYHAPFYITQHELEKSRKEKARFYLYRLYDFDEKEHKAKFCVQRGSLENLCINPILYKVLVKENKSSENEELPAKRL